MSLTLPEIKQKLKLLDEITLLELLEITSEDLVDRFFDFVEENADYIEGELSDDNDE